MRLWEFAVVFQPDEESEEKPEIIVPVSQVLASSAEQVKVIAARKIPVEFEDRLNDCEVMIRPFN